jgi:hypothetical protein
LYYSARQGIRPESILVDWGLPWNLLHAIRSHHACGRVVPDRHEDYLAQAPLKPGCIHGAVLFYHGGFMSRHKKINRAKEIDRKRKRRKESLKLRVKEAKAAGK